MNHFAVGPPVNKSCRPALLVFADPFLRREPLFIFSEEKKSTWLIELPSFSWMFFFFRLTIFFSP